jgi:hypothetical protein
MCGTLTAGPRDADVLARSLEALAHGRQDDRDELRAYPACREAASVTNAGEVEHAYAGSGSLCGLPEPVVELMRHHFAPDRLDSCQRCAAAVRAEREFGVEPRTR